MRTTGEGVQGVMRFLASSASLSGGTSSSEVSRPQAVDAHAIALEGGEHLLMG